MEYPLARHAMRRCSATGGPPASARQRPPAL